MHKIWFSLSFFQNQVLVYMFYKYSTYDATNLFDKFLRVIMKIKDKTRVAEFICPGRPLYKAWLSWSLWVGSGLWVIYSFKWTKRFYHYKELNYFAKWYMYSIKTALIREWLFKLQSWCKMNCVQWSSICPFSLAMHDLLQQCTHLWDNIKPHLKSKGM